MRIIIDDSDRVNTSDRPWVARITYGRRNHTGFGDTPAEALDALLSENNLPADPAEPVPAAKQPIPASGKLYARSQVNGRGSEVREEDGTLTAYDNHGERQALEAHYVVPQGQKLLFVGEAFDGSWDEFAAKPKL
jgi:hypothetical protein